MLQTLGNRTTFAWGGCDNQPYDAHEQAYDYCSREGWGVDFNLTYFCWNKLSDWKSAPFLKRADMANSHGLVIVGSWGVFYEFNNTLQVEMRRLLDWIDSELHSATFIYRSASMAHPNCNKYHEPSNNGVFLPADGPHKNWHWADYPAQREIWQSWLFKPENLGQGLYLDIFHLMAKRPDLHSHRHKNDCLHYCIPGPVDIYPVLILNLLRLVEELGETKDKNFTWAWKMKRSQRHNETTKFGLTKVNFRKKL